LTVLCALADLADPGAAGFTVEQNGQTLSVVVVRRRKKVFGWVNSCPHLWVPLNLEPNQFLNLSGDFILCSMHGALFDPASGACVLGPCRGQGLKPFPVTVRDGMVLAGSNAAGGCFKGGT